MKSKKSLIPFIISVTVLVVIFMGRQTIFTKEFFSSVWNGKRELPPKQPETGFRLVGRIPEKDGSSYHYEIELKFSENISADDFDVTVDKPNTPLKKLVLPHMPNTLWIIPVNRWQYNIPYNLTIDSTNPDKKLSHPIRVEYEYKYWPGPVGFDDPEGTQQATPTKNTIKK